MFDDKELQEKDIMKSSLDWTIVRPVILTNKKKRGNCRSFTANDTSLQAKISREDVAEFLLNQINNPNHIKKAISISY
ncbi:MAG: SDR family oxidoreductase [Spirochaetes bacterium]|nr:SDR family oxidoreductase [Spirochaetota bacterium]